MKPGEHGKDRLPSLALPAVPGGNLQPLCARNRRAPVVLLLHDADCAACHACARQLVAAQPSLTEWDGQLVVVVADSLENATRWREEMAASDTSLRVLSDADGRIARACGVQLPALLIADQWGVIYHAEEAGPEHRFSSPIEVADWVRFVTIQCPECQAETL